MKKKEKLVRLVMCALFSALIVVMTFTPYLGYISVGPIEITTLHIIAIFGALVLGPKYGSIVGGVWGLTCIVRAIQLGFAPFANPMVSLVPRILVGLVAGLVFWGLSKTKCPKVISLVIATLAGTLTNTVLVITALTLFNGFESLLGAAASAIETIILTLIGTNGLIELISALVIVPSLYMSTEKFFKSKL
ncbi:MAG: ECF transporter S component [Clostridia bacterium]|nr:ECF transporter S component [Clostridia bacterium]